MKIRTEILLKVYLMYLLLFAFAILILFRVWQIQYIQGDKWAAMADSLQTKFFTVDAARGNIYSEDGYMMAASLPEYELRIDFKADGLTDELFNNNVNELSNQLSLLFKDKSAKEYAQLLKNARTKGERYFLLKRKVSHTQYKQVKTFPIFSLGRNKSGLIAVQQNKRILPFKDLAARTIGYNSENVQPVGLEGAYGEFINGSNGKRLMRRISGAWMPINEEEEIIATDGSDIISTININIQDVAHNSLKKQLELQEADYGVVILMEVATGEIRAIVNLTKVPGQGYKETYNYAVGSAQEPGSTFKLASLMVGLDDGKFDTSTVYDVGMAAQYRNRTMRDAHAMPGRHSVRTIFMQSSNVGTSKAVYDAYADNQAAFVAGLERMGFGKKMGLDIPGEARPLLKHPKNKDWYSTTLPWLSIGYEQLITPLQTLTYYNGVANNGRLVAPMFVKEIRFLGESIKKFEPRVLLEQMAKPSTIAKARGMLEAVVTEGTGKRLQNPYYTIAGKTGTAQIADGSRGYKTGKVRYLASFCGYFPAEEPKYSMIVIISNPTKSAYYGGAVAAPVFRDIADKVFASRVDIHKGIHVNNNRLDSVAPVIKVGYKPDLEKVYAGLGMRTVQSTTSGDWVMPIFINNVVALGDIPQTEDLMPDVTGMSLQDVLYVLENLGLKPIVKGSGRVVRQSVLPGGAFSIGQQILIELK